MDFDIHLLTFPTPATISRNWPQRHGLKNLGPNNPGKSREKGASWGAAFHEKAEKD